MSAAPPRFFPYSRHSSGYGSWEASPNNSIISKYDDEMAERVGRLLAEQETLNELKKKTAFRDTTVDIMRQPEETAVSKPEAQTTSKDRRELEDFHIYNKAKGRVGIALPSSPPSYFLGGLDVRRNSGHSSSRQHLSDSMAYESAAEVLADSITGSPHIHAQHHCSPQCLHEAKLAKAHEVITRQQSHLERVMELAEQMQADMADKEAALLEARRALEIEQRSNLQLAAYVTTLNQRLSEARQEAVEWKRTERAKLVEERITYEERANAALQEALQIGKEGAADTLAATIEVLIEQKATVEGQIADRKLELESLAMRLEGRRQMVAEEEAMAQRVAAEREWLHTSMERKRHELERSKIEEELLVASLPTAIHGALEDQQRQRASSLHTPISTAGTEHSFLLSPPIPSLVPRSPPIMARVEQVIRSTLEAEAARSRVLDQRQYAHRILNESVGLVTPPLEGPSSLDDPLLNAFVVDAYTRTQLRKATEQRRAEQMQKELLRKAADLESSNQQHQLEAAAHEASLAARDNEIGSLKETVNRYTNLLESVATRSQPSPPKPLANTPVLSEAEAKAKYSKLLEALAAAPYGDAPTH